MTALLRAGQLGLIGCQVCGLVSRAPSFADPGCSRCGSALRRRKPASLSRTWALLLAAFIVYIPANLLPIMRTASLGDVDDNTILSGIVELWEKDSQALAIIVFSASIVVPMLKFLALLVLLICVHRRSHWAQLQRSKLYRLIELIGHWSMLDVFVVALLTALVRFNLLSSVEPLPGVIFFGLTVVLTMFASLSFDPRLTWDHEEPHDRG
jgi:paraquat-inducible protein A